LPFSTNFSGSFVVEASASKEIEVSFKPTAQNPYNSTIQISSDKTDGISSIQVSGSSSTGGGQGILTVSNSIDFGTAILNANSTKTLTISNSGTAPLSVTELTTSNADFSITQPALPLTLNVGSPIDVNVSMNTQSAGQKSTTLTINSSVGSKSVDVSGNVTNNTGGGCSTFVDQRDGDSYGATMIAGKCWMAENLRYNTPNAGDDTPYNNDATLLLANGRYYTWTVVMAGGQANNNNPSNVQGVCPDGWHLPSKSEMETLFNYFGGDKYLAYTGLIDGGSSGLNFKLAGKWSTGILGWNSNGTRGYYWTTTKSGSEYIVAGFNIFMIQGQFDFGSESGAQRMPCRCVKD
jgi:uncharacterized protein (TIGR02145 family)